MHKLLTCNTMHHPKADVDRLYIPSTKGEREMIQLELAYKTSTNYGSIQILYNNNRLNAKTSCCT